jgi:hypothetical protein
MAARAGYSARGVIRDLAKLELTSPSLLERGGIAAIAEAMDFRFGAYGGEMKRLSGGGVQSNNHSRNHCDCRSNNGDAYNDNCRFDRLLLLLLTSERPRS